MNDEVIKSNWVANWTTILGVDSFEKLHIFGWFQGLLSDAMFVFRDFWILECVGYRLLC
jgi:hypothetical protein